MTRSMCPTSSSELWRDPETQGPCGSGQCRGWATHLTGVYGRITSSPAASLNEIMTCCPTGRPSTCSGDYDDRCGLSAGPAWRTARRFARTGRAKRNSRVS